MRKTVIIYIVALLLVPSLSAFAKTAVDDEGTTTEGETLSVEKPADSKVGQKEAQKYFKASSDSAGSGDHYLAIHLGSYFSSDSYAWGGTSHLSNMGRLNIGLTYRLGNYGSFAADTALRLDFISYDLPEGRPVQVIVLPMILFPEVGSKFPLYFGIGLGAGFFFNQINQESFITANYQLVAGARFFDVVEATGFFLEGGLKNNILLMSDGQFIGYFLAVGAVFTF